MSDVVTLEHLQKIVEAVKLVRTDVATLRADVDRLPAAAPAVAPPAAPTAPAAVPGRECLGAIAAACRWIRLALLALLVTAVPGDVVFFAAAAAGIQAETAMQADPTRHPLVDSSTPAAVKGLVQAEAGMRRAGWACALLVLLVAHVLVVVVFVALGRVQRAAAAAGTAPTGGRPGRRAGGANG